MAPRIRLLGRPGDDDLVQTLLEADPGYTERVTGLPPGASDGLSTLTMTPPGTQPTDKHVIGGEEKPWDYAGFTSVSRLFERPVERPQPPPDLAAGPGWVIDGTTLLPRVTDVAAFREGLADDPFQEAIEALWSGDHTTARELLEAADPTVRVRGLLADCAREEGHTARAVSEYADLLAEQTGSPWEPVLRQHYAKALLADGQVQRARETFETAYELRLQEGTTPAQLASSALGRDRLRET